MSLIKNYDGTLYSTGRNKKFTEVWNTADEFVNDYANVGIPTTIDTNNVITLYYLLYARYGNDRIASSDETRFKYGVFSLIFREGGAWIKRLEIQQALANIDFSSNDWLIGVTTIYNHANNPSNDPDDNTTTELDYIDSQNVTKQKRGILEGYQTLELLLKTDVTNEFIERFKSLFMTIIDDVDLLYEV